MTQPETDVINTRRRAEIRGRESVARWRIESGVWSGRLFAVIYAVLAILPLLSGGREAIAWESAASWLVLAVAICIATEQMKKGSRGAASFLIALFVVAKTSAWLLTGQPLWSGAFWTIILAGGLLNGVWGTFTLASARRDAAHVPPAPARQLTPFDYP